MAYQWSFNGAQVAGATNSFLTRSSAQPTDAGDYYVEISNAYGSITSGPVTMTVFSVQPTNLTVFAGHDAQFALMATPPTPLQCQWQFGGTNLPGATNATLLLSAATKEQAGLYTLTVKSPTGQAASSAAALLVRDPPAAVLASALCPDGGPFQFTVTGAGDLAYVVEVSTNLLDWQPLITNTPPFAVVAQNATNSLQRFYRALCRP
jgi:hypothetical protein